MNKIRTKKGRVVNEKTLLVTVDIGKVMNTGYCRCPDKTEVKPFTFQNNYEGFNKFFSVIVKTKTAKKLKCVVVEVESLRDQFRQAAGRSAHLQEGTRPDEEAAVLRRALYGARRRNHA